MAAVVGIRRRHFGSILAILIHVVASVLLLRSRGAMASIDGSKSPVVASTIEAVDTLVASSNEASVVAEQKMTLHENERLLLQARLSLSCELSTHYKSLERPNELETDEKWFIRVEELTDLAKAPPSLLYLERPVVFGWFHQDAPFFYSGFNATVPIVIASPSASPVSSTGGYQHFSLPELQALNKELKQKLKEYDMIFARKNGRMPKKAEKEPIRHLCSSTMPSRVRSICKDLSQEPS